MKVVEIKDFERESKKREFKEKIDTKIQNGKERFIRNKETIIVLAPVVVGCSTTFRYSFRNESFEIGSWSLGLD